MSKLKLLNWLLVAALLLNSWVGYQVHFSLTQSSKLEIFMLDIGQGDSILIRTPDGGYGLIDGGRGKTVLTQLGQALPVGWRSLDFVLATHPDADHIEGLLSVLETYQVKNVFWGKSNSDSGVYAKLKQEVSELNLPNYALKDDNDFKLGCCTDFDILWPRETYDTYAESETNKLSITILLQYGKFKMFLGGDLPAEQELDAVSDLPERDISVLKVGHHGSRTSTSSQFLDEVKPEIALISVGLNNSYGHPHREVLDTLQEHQVHVFRTDQMGRIALETDGNTIDVQTEKGVENFQLNI